MNKAILVERDMNTLGYKTIWTEAMDKFLRDNYTRIGTEATAKRLGLGRSTIASRADWLGITKRRDQDVLKTTDIFDIKVQRLKGTIKVGDKVRGRTVTDIYPHYIVVTNGRYKETFSWFELANPKHQAEPKEEYRPKKSKKKAS